MKFAKKSLSVVLAVLMMATSLVTGTVAFAAKTPKTFLPYAQGTTATVGVTQKADGSTENVSYFTFTPATTGTYSLFVQANTSFEESSVSIYEKYNSSSCELKDCIAYVESEQSYGSQNLDRGYETFNLVGGETYYIRAYVSCRTKATDEYNAGNVLKFSIAPTDFSAYLTSYKDDASKTTVYGYEVRYTGSSTAVVVPAEINWLPVINVQGTDNKNITSLNLANAASVKLVSGFSNCKKLSSVALNFGLKCVDDDAFYNCKALTSIVIPDMVKTISNSAFEGCTSLSSAVIGNGVEYIEGYAFYNTALKAMVVPASVKSIGNCAIGYADAFDLNTVDPYDVTPTPVAGFAIGSVAGSAAQLYAAKNGIAFCDVNNCAHAYNVVAFKDSTLFKAGSKTEQCAICGASKTTQIAKKKIAVKSVKSSKKARLVVKAAKQSGITGYQIQYSTSKKFTKKTTKSVKVKTTKALSKTIKGLKSGKKYYVRVRAYKVSGKKTTYGVYGAAKSVKVK